MICALTLVCLTVVVSGVTSIVANYRATEESAYDTLTDKAGISAVSMQRRADVLKKELMIESTNTDIRDYSRSVKERSDILKKASDRSDFLEFSVAKSSGVTYNSDGKINISDREYFQKAMDGTPIISNPLIQRRDNSLVLMSATKFEDGSGVCFGVIPYDAFNAALKDLHIGDTGYVYMLDKNGVVILYPDFSVIEAMCTFSDFAGTEGLKSEDVNYYTALGKLSDEILEKGGSGASEVTANGVTNMVAYMPVEGPEGWTAVSIVPKEEMFASFYSQLFIMLAALIIMLVVGLLLAIWFSRLFTGPIRKISDRLHKLSEGDLHSEVVTAMRTKDFQDLYDVLENTTGYLREYIGDVDYVLGHIAEGELDVRSRVDYVGDFVGIGASLNHIQANLSGLIKGIVDSTEHILTQSGQLSCSAQELADGSISSATSLKHLSDTIAHVNDSIAATVTETIAAGQLSGAAKQTAADGNDKVRYLLKSIDDINAAASSIESINKVIEEIAFQTNILALNATIEAARAGIAGKSFNVVAEEVRSLAARSAQASKETSDLIVQVIAAISEGAASAGATAETFEEIQKSVNKVDEIMSSVSKEAAAQAQQITGLNHDIDHISQVTESSSAASIELAETSKGFESQAGILSRIVAGFKFRKR
jgi:methyl-accepting chemotaxis protein